MASVNLNPPQPKLRVVRNPEEIVVTDILPNGSSGKRNKQGYRTQDIVIVNRDENTYSPLMFVTPEVTCVSGVTAWKDGGMTLLISLETEPAQKFFTTLYGKLRDGIKGLNNHYGVKDPNDLYVKSMIKTSEKGYAPSLSFKVDSSFKAVDKEEHLILDVPTDRVNCRVLFELLGTSDKDSVYTFRLLARKLQILGEAPKPLYTVPVPAGIEDVKF